MRFSFLFNEVLTGLRRNITMTVAMILTTAISIGLFGGGLLVVRLADHSRSIYLDRVETQVFLTNDISADDANCESAPCKALREKIEKRNDVKSVRFLNRQDAYNDAIRKLPQFKDLASKDAFPASFVVKLENPEQHAEFDAAMQGQPGVDHVLNQKELIDRLFGVLDGSWRFLLTAATASTSTVAAARAKNSGHIRHTTGAWCSSTKSIPNATPDPTVSQATLLVNLCVRTSSSSGDSRLTRITANIANTTPTQAVSPGRSPSATPTATGTAALSTAASGETTEIGPALTAA